MLKCIIHYHDNQSRLQILQGVTMCEISKDPQQLLVHRHYPYSSYVTYLPRGHIITDPSYAELIEATSSILHILLFYKTDMA